jgi:ribose/xylose/arabinose/galactoside ABC-type transport system permease subunit
MAVRGEAELLERMALPTSQRRLRIPRTSGLLWALLLLCAVAVIISPAFLNPFNLINVLRQVALFGIVSIGMTFVIITAGIDLAVGSIVAVTAVAAALMLKAGIAIRLVIVAGLCIGVAMGGVSGLGVTLGGVPPSS